MITPIDEPPVPEGEAPADQFEGLDRTMLVECFNYSSQDVSSIFITNNIIDA
jgi:hypothetical protein